MCLPFDLTFGVTVTLLMTWLMWSQLVRKEWSEGKIDVNFATLFIYLYFLLFAWAPTYINYYKNDAPVVLHVGTPQPPEDWMLPH